MGAGAGGMRNAGVHVSCTDGTGHKHQCAGASRCARTTPSASGPSNGLDTVGEWNTTSSANLGFIRPRSLARTDSCHSLWNEQVVVVVEVGWGARCH